MWLWIKDALAMFLLLVIIGIAWLFMSLVEPAQAQSNLAPTELVEVERVIDGDTFETKGGEMVRMWGYDAPELGAYGGYEAKVALEAIVHHNDIVCGRLAYRSYGRAVMRCFMVTGWIDIGYYMVRNGHGRDVPEYSNGAYFEAMTEAVESCRGVWSQYCT